LSYNNLQVVGDRPSVKEYLRLLSSVLALVSGNDAAELAKVKPFAVEAVQVRSYYFSVGGYWVTGTSLSLFTL
jgi:hypothetical protein